MPKPRFYITAQDGLCEICIVAEVIRLKIFRQTLHTFLADESIYGSFAIKRFNQERFAAIIFLYVMDSIWEDFKINRPICAIGRFLKNALECEIICWLAKAAAGQKKHQTEEKNPGHLLTKVPIITYPCQKMDVKIYYQPLMDLLQAEKIAYADAADSLQEYGWDYLREVHQLPAIIIWPNTAQQVSSILRLANNYLWPVTARGAGTSLSAAAVPTVGGIVLDLKKMNRILHIDLPNSQAIVEAGVINQALADAVAQFDLYYPPDPASRGSSTIGGNIAHSSGGPRAVKYGTTRDYVLNLEVVLANGEVIWTGANTLKFSAGYNLTQLFIGSEGTLGIVTKAVLKLVPMPKHRQMMIAEFGLVSEACSAVAKIFQAGFTPSALEMVAMDAWQHTLKFAGKPLRNTHASALLLIEADGITNAEVQTQIEGIYGVLESNAVQNVELAETFEEQERIWAIRRGVGEAAKSASSYKEEDCVVPRAKLPALMEKLEALKRQWNFRAFSYGHAGDGNIHINILRDNLNDDEWQALSAPIAELLSYAVELGGAISGEHGIGLTQKPFLPLQLNSVSMDLLKGIKRVFDPQGILNPGKIF